jgi:hypothetical protein
MADVQSYGLFGPILALIGWTFVMWIWLYATRIPAMRKAGIDPKELSRTGAKLSLPPEVSRVADNYNHLHEQPTIFYALTLTAELSGAAENVSILLAWGYVVLRIVHSLVQATHNIIRLRFAVFSLASLTLLVLFVQTVRLLVQQT